MSDQFDPPLSALRAIVALALAEDMGSLGDITSIACVADDQAAVASFVAREEGVLAGTAAATEVFTQLDPHVIVEWNVRDGEPLEPGVSIGRVSGSLRSILGGERVALNLLCHCSGVASLTRRYVQAAGWKARIRDTRKTLPGLRTGGGFNHRDSLSDAVLIKDNHLATTGLGRAVERAKARWPGRIIEVECDSLEQVKEAREAAVDIVLLDNMTAEQVHEAVKILDKVCRVEVSGRVSVEAVGAYAEAGADFISVGAITHSARTLDIGLDIA